MGKIRLSFPSTYSPRFPALLKAFSTIERLNSLRTVRDPEIDPDGSVRKKGSRPVCSNVVKNP